MLRNYFLLFIFLLVVPAPLLAADLVNINTADKATLMTLTGLGGTGVKAQAVIDYRTQNGPFQKIEDIMNVSGIGQATFNGFKDRITVGDAAQTQTQTQPQTQATSTPTQTQVAVSLGGVGPPPITAQITADTVTAAGAGTYFAGEVFGTKGEPLSGARYIWNFGDGATAEGVHQMHTYVYPGSYDVELSVGYNYSSATARVLVVAKAPQVALVLQADNSLLVVNNSTQDLSLGEWSLESGHNTFVIPPDTLVHAQGGVRFAPLIMGFAAQRGALLRFPNNTTAATSTLANDSPLHGEQVALSTPPTDKTPVPMAKAPVAKITAAKTIDQAAAVVATPVSREVGWSYVVGLAAIIALGVVGTYYAYTKPKTVTEAAVDEFDIE